MHVGLLFGKRLDTNLLHRDHMHWVRRYLDSPSTRHRIHCGFIFFILESGLKKYPDSLMKSFDACGRKPHPKENKNCGLKKYLDTCERGARLSHKVIHLLLEAAQQVTDAT